MLRSLGQAVVILSVLTYTPLVLAQPSRFAPIPPAEKDNPLKELIAGQEFLPPEIRALQDDEFDNPSYSFVEGGERLFSIVNGEAGKSCQSCHEKGDHSKQYDALRTAVATYPKFSSQDNKVITLGRRINMCREKNMRAAPWDQSSTELLAMLAFLRSEARGLPANVDITGPNQPTFERGKALYETNMGRLQLSCAQCHNQNYGRKYGKDVLSQGHPLAYPAFKISEQRPISLHDRFRICNELARAEPQSEDSPDYVALELYISWRSKNLPITGPGVRP